ncbi:dynein regulator LIS1 [Artemisia annua]|uniref:Dynein regulator LIS1 n=1 Tax=Artemisia annua TaxID=35608 RepID=A0A2U1M1B3_ARTAN|nr:dynein regulator LIS1 [Artemisia annua]
MKVTVRKILISMPILIQRLIVMTLDKYFDYLSNGEDEVIELRKRKLDYKQGADEVDEQYEPTEANKDTTKENEYFNGFGSTPFVRQHEKYMEALLRKIKGNGVGITDPFTLVEKSKERVLVGLYSGNVNIWNYRSQVTEKSFEIAKSPVRAAKFIANKEWICGADDGFIRVYNYNTMESVAELKAHTDFVRSFAVHPSLPYVLSASDDKTIKLWDWEKGWECTKTFEGHEHYVMQVAFNPRDTNAFASVSLDSTIKVLYLHNPTIVHYRLYFITGSDDYTAKVWDYDTMTCLQTLEGHTNNVTSIQYVKSDVSFIITGSEDKTVCIWNVTTHKLDHVFTSELGRIWTIMFIKESSEIILGCDEGILVGQIISTHP